VLQVWVALATMITGHESLQSFPLGLPQRLCTTPTCTVFRNCEWKLKLLLKRSKFICCMIQLTTLWFVCGVREVKGSRIEHVFTWRPHAYKLSTKVNFHSCIICFSALDNYKYTRHWNCCMFFWILCIWLIQPSQWMDGWTDRLIGLKKIFTCL